MATIQEIKEQIDELLIHNKFEDALKRLLEFDEAHSTGKDIILKNQHAKWIQIKEDLMGMAGNEDDKIRRDKVQLRTILFETNAVIATEAESKDGHPSNIPSIAPKSGPVQIFVSRALEDEHPFERIKRHLALLVFSKKATVVDQQNLDLTAQATAEEALNYSLEQAEIVLLILSSNFMADINCLMLQEKALRAFREKGTYVIPILWSNVEYDILTDLTKMMPLPRNKKFIQNWENEEQAFSQIGAEIQNLIVKKLRPE